jgi:hypothetical protein
MQYFRNSLLLIVAVATFASQIADASTVSVVNIDASTLSSVSLKPTLSGTASGIKKVKISITKEGSSKVVFKKSSVKVKNGKWTVKVSKKLSEGSYNVDVSGTKGVLTIGGTTFSVSSIPLLSGGTARVGTTVPISYLKVVNTGKTSGTLTGFSLRQNGSAPASAVSSFETVDGTGQIRATSSDILFVPTNASFAPGEMRVFTIKAVLGSASVASIGKDLKYEVTALQGNMVATAKFPIQGTTWTIGY